MIGRNGNLSLLPDQVTICSRVSKVWRQHQDCRAVLIAFFSDICRSRRKTSQLKPWRISIAVKWRPLNYASLCPWRWKSTFWHSNGPSMNKVGRAFTFNSFIQVQIRIFTVLCTPSRKETGGGEGVEIIKNEPFFNTPILGDKFSSGQYTYKIYHVETKVPKVIRYARRLLKYTITNFQRNFLSELFLSK